jgi:hypothetical protein
MFRCTFWKRLTLLGAVVLASSISLISMASADNQKGLIEVAASLEKALPKLVSAADYRSASNTAFLLATARSRLHQTAAACAALSQSLEYYRKAIANETGMQQKRTSGLNEDSDGMAEVRSKFGCTQS